MMVIVMMMMMMIVMMVMMMVIVMLYVGYTADGWISMIDEDATSSSLTGINIELDH